MVCAVGTASSTSRGSACSFVFVWTSTTGDPPETVTVSSTAPTFRSALIVAVKFDPSSMPSRLTVAKPGSVNVSPYVPGRRFSIRYTPLASVLAERTPSISAGLLASTVTPGSTPPVASFTTPANALCAPAVAGSTSELASVYTSVKIRPLIMPFTMPVPPSQRTASRSFTRPQLLEARPRQDQMRPAQGEGVPQQFLRPQ